MSEIGAGGFLVWLLVPTVMIAVMIAIGVAVVRIGFQVTSRDGPRRILRERYARGEITQAEFEQALRALGS